MRCKETSDSDSNTIPADIHCVWNRWETGDSVSIHCAWNWWHNRRWLFSEHSVCMCENGDWQFLLGTIPADIHCGHTTLAKHVRDCADIWRHHYSRGHSPSAWNWLGLTPDGTTGSLDTAIHCAWMDSWWLLISDGNTISVYIDMAVTNGSRWQHYYSGYSLAKRQRCFIFSAYSLAKTRRCSLMETSFHWTVIFCILLSSWDKAVFVAFYINSTSDCCVHAQTLLKLKSWATLWSIVHKLKQLIEIDPQTHRIFKGRRFKFTGSAPFNMLSVFMPSLQHSGAHLKKYAHRELLVF